MNTLNNAKTTEDQLLYLKLENDKLHLDNAKLKEEAKISEETSKKREHIIVELKKETTSLIQTRAENEKFKAKIATLCTNLATEKESKSALSKKVSTLEQQQHLTETKLQNQLAEIKRISDEKIVVEAKLKETLDILSTERKEFDKKLKQQQEGSIELQREMKKIQDEYQKKLEYCEFEAMYLKTIIKGRDGSEKQSSEEYRKYINDGSLTVIEKDKNEKLIFEKNELEKELEKHKAVLEELTQKGDKMQNELNAVNTKYKDAADNLAKKQETITRYNRIINILLLYAWSGIKFNAQKVTDISCPDELMYLSFYFFLIHSLYFIW